MKKMIYLVILMFSIQGLAAQNNTFEKNNVLKISPIEFGRAEFKLSYERYFNNRQSSILISPTLILKGDDEDARVGWRAMAQYRYYLSHLNVSNENEFLGIYNLGFYAGLYGLYLDYQDKYSISTYDNETGMNIIYENERNINAQEGGAIVGLQMDLTQRFVIDFYVGGGIRFSAVQNSVVIENDYYSPSRGGIFPYEYNGVKPTFGLMVGLLF